MLAKFQHQIQALICNDCPWMRFESSYISTQPLLIRKIDYKYKVYIMGKFWKFSNVFDAEYETNKSSAFEALYYSRITPCPTIPVANPNLTAVRAACMSQGGVTLK